MTYDMFIVGAGITGAAIARELSRYKLKVLLLEKEAGAAFGVSKSNSGIIHAGTRNSPASVKGWLCVEGAACCAKSRAAQNFTTSMVAPPRVPARRSETLKPVVRLSRSSLAVLATTASPRE